MFQLPESDICSQHCVSDLGAEATKPGSKQIRQSVLRATCVAAAVQIEAQPTAIQEYRERDSVVGYTAVFHATVAEEVMTGQGRRAEPTCTVVFHILNECIHFFGLVLDLGKSCKLLKLN